VLKLREYVDYSPLLTVLFWNTSHRYFDEWAVDVLCWRNACCCLKSAGYVRHLWRICSIHLTELVVALKKISPVIQSVFTPHHTVILEP